MVNWVGLWSVIVTFPGYTHSLAFFHFLVHSQEKNQKGRLFKKVQAFCEEKDSRSLLGVFGYVESKNQCW